MVHRGEESSGVEEAEEDQEGETFHHRRGTNETRECQEEDEEVDMGGVGRSRGRLQDRGRRGGIDREREITGEEIVRRLERQ